MTPQRIQRRRTKGWRMPPNTVYVGRGSAYGNPFRIGDLAEGMDMRAGGVNVVHEGKPHHYMDAREVVARYAKMVNPYRHHGPTSTLDCFFLSVAQMQDIQTNLRGKNLACWCALDQPCHADVLISIANGELIDDEIRDSGQPESA